MNRIFVGGCWINRALFARVANRSGSIPGYRGNYLSFRIARGKQ